jgi:hypothetical protein
MDSVFAFETVQQTAGVIVQTSGESLVIDSAEHALRIIGYAMKNS